MSFNFNTEKEMVEPEITIDSDISKDQTADYATYFKFIVLPHWVEEAIARNNAPREICIDGSKLSSILSLSDVQNYMDNDYLMKSFLWHNSSPQMYLINVINYTVFDKHPGIREYTIKENYDNSIANLKNALFNYYLDQDMVSDNLNSYYVTLKPYCDNIIAVRLHKASPDENVYEKRATALADWISLARKYVSFDSIARAGVIKSYLNHYAQYLDSVSNG